MIGIAFESSGYEDNEKKITKPFFPSLFSASILDITLDYTENDYEKLKNTTVTGLDGVKGIFDFLNLFSNPKPKSLLDSKYDIYKIWNIKMIPPISQLPLCLAYYNLVHSELREISKVATGYDVLEGNEYEIPIQNIKEEEFIRNYKEMINKLCKKQLQFENDNEKSVSEDYYNTSIAFSYKIIKSTSRYSNNFISLVKPLEDAFNQVLLKESFIYNFIE